MAIHKTTIVVYVCLVVFTGCKDRTEAPQAPVVEPTVTHEPARPIGKGELLAPAAMEQVGKTTMYDPAYMKLAYPGGDVPIDRGVCTDVVVRAMRKLDIDLQVLIHEDMKASFASCPNLWGLKHPDPNIDHRRVPNIATYLRRKHKGLPISENVADYLPGDIVVWRFTYGRPHTGIVSTIPVEEQRRYKMVHNVGAGACVEDVLFAWRIEGHFRYF